MKDLPSELVPISLWLSTKIISELFAEREPLTGRGGLMTGNKQVIRWVLLAQAGDQEALNELFKAIQHQRYQYIVTLVGERSLAEDILQEVFIQIFRKLRWLREPKLLHPWVYRIATREAFRWLKKKRRWMQLVSDDADLDVIQALPTRENFPRELV